MISLFTIYTVGTRFLISHGPSFCVTVREIIAYICATVTPARPTPLGSKHQLTINVTSLNCLASYSTAESTIVIESLVNPRDANQALPTSRQVAMLADCAVSFCSHCCRCRCGLLSMQFLLSVPASFNCRRVFLLLLATPP